MDFTLYWFMFPVSICVASCAMLSGIGGAALFTPIFVLLFPLLGPEYVLASTFAANRPAPIMIPRIVARKSRQAILY